MLIGLVGLPLSGKSTLFGLLTGTPVTGSAKPEARLGSAEVPDERIDHLAAIYKPRKKTYARIDFMDIPGLTPGDEKKDNLFLEKVRKVDALVYVLRAFANPDVPHIEGHIAPLTDWEIIETELLLADLDLFEKRIARTKAAKKKPPGWDQELPLLEKCRDALAAGNSLRSLNLTETEQAILHGYGLLTEKPIIPVVNVDENQFNSKEYPQQAALEAKAQEQNLMPLEICAQLELEINQLDPDDKNLFLEDLGLKVPGIQKLAKAAYDALRLISFFTVGEDEVKAWTIKQGTVAQEAAGKIHSDMARGFIRAEILAYQHLLEAGTVAKAREKGLYRLEGKLYPMEDGDITNIRFNI
ncbi:MAG: redox-regulated ATPase YchF [bacterium]|jgi:GTP-binding protein YchF